MDDVKKLDDPMTIMEAVDKLENFKQQIIDQSYEELVDEGETQATIDMEVIDALESILYYIKTLDQLETEEL